MGAYNLAGLDHRRLVDALLADARGLNFATAGSVNNGSRLTGMRLLMAAVQRHGRYG